MSTIFILVGVPGSGKSTWVRNRFKDFTTISSDDILDEIAKYEGKTYNDVFSENIDLASNAFQIILSNSISDNRNIIIDRTNLNPKSRKSILRHIPENYKKIAIVFKTPSKEELETRLSSRPGKNIPDVIVKTMIENFTYPSLDEGFSEIIDADNI